MRKFYYLILTSGMLFLSSKVVFAQEKIQATLVGMPTNSTSISYVWKLSAPVSHINVDDFFRVKPTIQAYDKQGNKVKSRFGEPWGSLLPDDTVHVIIPMESLAKGVLYFMVSIPGIEGSRATTLDGKDTLISGKGAIFKSVLGAPPNGVPAP